MGETLPVASYRDWGLLLPEGSLRVGVGQAPFLALLRELRGTAVANEWDRFLTALRPSCEAARSLPLLALRPGAGLATTLGGGNALRLLSQAGRLAGLAVYGSPYAWETLVALLDTQVPAGWSPGQMALAQGELLGRLGFGPQESATPDDDTTPGAAVDFTD